jgi:Flp pilus assembly protein TadD
LELKSRILLASGDLTGAESLLRKTLSEDPANQQLRADLISCLRRQGRNSDADRETQIEK